MIRPTFVPVGVLAVRRLGVRQSLPHRFAMGHPTFPCDLLWPGGGGGEGLAGERAGQLAVLEDELAVHQDGGDAF